jgi:hypothetical protein
MYIIRMDFVADLDDQKIVTNLRAVYLKSVVTNL